MVIFHSYVNVYHTFTRGYGIWEKIWKRYGKDMGMDWDEVGMLKNDSWRDSIVIFDYFCYYWCFVNANE